MLTFAFWLSCSVTPQRPAKIIGIDSDGMLRIKGKRTFIIGTYDLPKSDSPFGELAQAGFNLVRTKATDTDLNKAQEKGLFAWIPIGYLEPNHEKESELRTRKLITRLKDHPALLAWEMCDEPAFTWMSEKVRVEPEPLTRTFQLIKQLDPLHLIYTNHAPVNLVSTLQKYNASTDIVACDIYPVVPPGIKPTYALFPDGRQGDLLNTYLSQVGEYTDKMRKVAGENHPVFMVLQGFAWEMLKEERERTPEMILYPNFGQSRFMAYDAIIHGANGIVYWGTSHIPQPSQFWTDLKRVTSQLSSIQEILSAETMNPPLNLIYHETGHSVDAGVEFLVKHVNSNTYLITANADRYPARVSFKRLEQFNECEVLFENRHIPIENGEFSQDFQPFAVHVFKLTKKINN